MFEPSFVLEQTLGHVTHSMNLKQSLSETEGVDVRWFDVNYRPADLRYRVPPVSLNWSLRGSLMARDILNSAAAKSSDAIFIHTLTIALLARGAYERTPTIISIDATPLNLDSVAAAYNHKKLPSGVERFKLEVAKRALEPARAYVAWCEWAKRSLVDDYGVEANKVHVIAPGSDVDLFDFPERQPNKTPRILFVGGDFVRKGGDLLLDVYRRRLKGRVELHLVTGSDLAEEEGVHVYKGLTANSPSLLELFRTADIFALPTRADCLAMVLGEAMASSLPVVTTTVGGHPEAVKHGETGFLTEPDDEEGLATALETLVDNPRLRVQMGRSSRELALEKFDARRNAKTILHLMKEIA